MSVLSKIESEVAAIDKTALGAQVLRAVRLAGAAAVGYVLVHITGVNSVASASAIVGGAVTSAEVAFRTVFPTTAKTVVANPAPAAKAAAAFPETIPSS